EQRTSPAAEETPTAVPQQVGTPTAELTPAPAKPIVTPAPEQSLSPAAPETPTAVPEQRATRTSEHQTRQPDAKSTIAPIATPPDDSGRSLTALPLALPKPPPLVDAQTVASFDTLYHAAVKANDIVIMDRILADDFVFVTDRGDTLTKAD